MRRAIVVEASQGRAGRFTTPFGYRWDPAALALLELSKRSRNLGCNLNGGSPKQKPELAPPRRRFSLSMPKRVYWHGLPPSALNQTDGTGQRSSLARMA